MLLGVAFMLLILSNPAPPRNKPMHLLLGGWLHIKTGIIPSDQSITVTLGSGLLIMAMMSSVEVDILDYWKEPQIVSEGQSVFSITKTGYTNIYTITCPQNIVGTYIFIGIG